MLTTLRNRNFALLWVAGLISIAGNWVLYIGLPLYTYQLTQSTLATSAMLIAGTVPRLFLGSVAGVFVDRWDRRRTMVIANLLMGAGLLPLLLVNSAESVWIIYGVQFFQACAAQFFAPAEAALLPTLVGEEHLISANALNSLNNNLARLIGPAVGGLVAGMFGLLGVTLVDSVTFFLAAALVSLINMPARVVPPSREESPRFAGLLTAVWREWLEGLRIILGERRIRLLFLIATIPLIGEGIFATLMVVFVTDVLGGGEMEMGYLMSAQAVGGLLGGLVVGQVARGMRLHRLMGFSAIVFGFLDLALFNYPAFIPGFLAGYLLMGIVGLPGIGYATGLETMLQKATPDPYRGRVWGAFGTTAALLLLVGMILAGYLGERVHVISILNIQGLGYVVTGLLALIFLGRAFDSARVAAPQPAEPAPDPIPEPGGD